MVRRASRFDRGWYRKERERWAEAVRSAVPQPGATLYGSFSRGDFHLDRGSGISRSDVDVVALQVTAQQARHLRGAIQADLRQRLGVEVAVSVHHEDLFAGISPEDSVVIACCEFFRRVPHLAPDDLEGLDYQRAKVALRISRYGRASLSREVELDVVRVKRGEQDRLEAPWHSVVGEASANDRTGLAHDVLLMSAQDVAARRLIEALGAARTPSPSLKSVVRARLERLVEPSP